MSFTANDDDDDDDFDKAFVCAKVISCESIENKDLLKICSLDIGRDREQIKVVTNAKNVRKDLLVAVCLCGYRDVRKMSVGGVISEGMLADAPMLRWKSGSHGLAAVLPDDRTKPVFFKAGDFVPRQRPRSDGMLGDNDCGDQQGIEREKVVVETMFARKLTKEEKKIALEEKRKARLAKKESD